MKEQSSILTPNNKLVGVEPTKEEPKLPKPTGWRLLVLPFKMKEKTKGGIHLAETTLERQQVASQVGLVLAMGPQCYKDKERYPVVLPRRHLFVLLYTCNSPYCQHHLM